MTAFIIGVVCFFVVLSIGSNIAGKVAYEEGVTDERRKWYIHAHCYHWKEEDFNHDNNNLKSKKRGNYVAHDEQRIVDKNDKSQITFLYTEEII